MCGVTGRISFSHQDVISKILDDLIHLQNRGRDATGFVVGHSNQLTPYVPWKKPASAGSLFGKESEAKADTLIKRYKGNLGGGRGISYYRHFRDFVVQKNKTKPRKSKNI